MILFYFISSLIKALHKEIKPRIIIIINGKAATIAIACNPCKPPESKSPTANNASTSPQSTFFLFEGFKLPFEVNIAKTKVAESAEVIKNVQSKTMVIIDTILLKG
ncbi:hypothetical protein M918_23635 [Clostridium sp. BL8]|nr:hypothetical protein M918_23635 [Clostridium sp. BL8]